MSRPSFVKYLYFVKFLKENNIYELYGMELERKANRRGEPFSSRKGAIRDAIKMERGGVFNSTLSWGRCQNPRLWEDMHNKFYRFYDEHHHVWRGLREPPSIIAYDAEVLAAFANAHTEGRVTADDIRESRRRAMRESSRFRHEYVQVAYGASITQDPEPMPVGREDPWGDL